MNESISSGNLGNCVAFNYLNVKDSPLVSEIIASIIDCVSSFS